MAYDNFNVPLWSSILLHECKAKSVYRADCWEQFKGEIKKQGDEIVFQNVGAPTVTEFDTEVIGKNPDVPEVEEVPDTALHMKVHKLSMYNFMVGDIDAAQANKDLMKILMTKTAEQVAQNQDKHIASIAKGMQSMWGGTTKKKVVVGTAGSGEMDVFDILDMAEEMMRDRNVAESVPLVLNCSNRFFTKVRKALREADTDNSAILENGRFRRVNNIVVKPSVNCARSDDKTTDYLMLRTPYAIGFADGLQKQVPYIPQAKLAEAIKGAALYQAKLLLPDECLMIPVTY